MRQQLAGLDHVVIAVADLAAAASEWRARGFTVSPRGEHGSGLGTANHTIMFEDAYVELMGVVAESPFNAITRRRIAEGGGLERIALRLLDPDGAAAELRAAGIAAAEPFAFGRPVPLENGGSAEARFIVLPWTVEPSPAGLGYFACRHLTPDTVWLPGLLRHANGSRQFQRVEIRVGDPAAEAAGYAAMTGLPADQAAPGEWRVADPRRGPAVAFLAPERFAARWSAGAGAPQAGLVFAAPQNGAAPPPVAAGGVLLGWEGGLAG
ncbi:VOC family protein [Teichococcus vastitatis]|uniref:VOC family protein n=1 Tax=Teichococcus vastitatis TaxID=2307076 RepID=A0ABS9W906_9PROT|nr:VOC family protein [Pseudoroseomonas vastitatis]MCI0755395.1 VOC family protein [Pseudoroseomonas vastitatis]